MLKERLEEMADSADMIVSGYAFKKKDNGFVSIVNLEHPDCAMVISSNGEMIETNMDDIEQHIVHDICSRNLQFLET